MRKKKRLLIALCAVIGALLLAAGVLAVSGLRDDIGKADVALVLGNKVEADGSPSARLRARLDRTVELYRAGYFPWIVVSGGVGVEGYDEAAVMRDYLVARGVPAERVVLDSTGLTTCDSAKNATRIARSRGFDSVFVVSQYFHLPRAVLALKRFGIPTVYHAHARFAEARDVYSLAREVFGYPYYLLRPCDLDDQSASLITTVTVLNCITGA